MSPEELNKFQNEESHKVEGITADFVWYESSVIRDALKHAVSTNMSRFEKVASVMEARHKEHLKIIQDLMNETDDLKRKLRDAKEAK